MTPAIFKTKDRDRLIKAILEDPGGAADRMLSFTEREETLTKRSKYYCESLNNLRNKYIDVPHWMSPDWAEKQARVIFQKQAIFNPVTNHREADKLMERILIAFGFESMVKFIRCQDRWYE